MNNKKKNKIKGTNLLQIGPTPIEKDNSSNNNNSIVWQSYIAIDCSVYFVLCNVKRKEKKRK